MKILVVGSGGREHALVWKLAQSKPAHELYAAPGNPGISEHAECIDIKADDVTGMAKFAMAESINMAVVGPEIPLCLGITDILEEAGIDVFGPSYKAAQIEGSKAFSKQIMRKYGVPTAEFENFTNFENAVAYARSLGTDMWIKASGLAAGKGAIYAPNPDEAQKILKSLMIDSQFGESGHEVVIEEHMRGEEASIFALCDGKTYKLLVSSQDHKRAYDCDKGPNTGGMGAYAPAPVITKNILDKVENAILQPTLEGMASEGAAYKGLLYAGIMITNNGPKVVEYNCRFGDPETQAVLPLLDGDLAEILTACARGDISRIDFDVTEGYAMCVVIASGGYPGSYKKGLPVSGLEDVAAMKNVKAFHAGTISDGDVIKTSGGRVFGVTGWGSDFTTAMTRAYAAVEKITFKDAFNRNDIGSKALKHL
ncbi:MAG: phosphoribosylamine--glycine ligase [Candidatus Latescibacteria bacterium]|nr:phosphoribosylamine--glycine ligase [Candidatus Latescibacterota bacterium]